MTYGNKNERRLSAVGYALSVIAMVGAGDNVDDGTGVGNGTGDSVEVVASVRMGGSDVAGEYAEESVGSETAKSSEHAVKSITNTAIR